SDLDRSIQAGECGGGQQRPHGVAAGKDNRRPGDQVGRHDMRRNGRLAQGTGERGPLEQDSQRGVRYQRVGPAGERSEQRPERERRDVPAPQRYPYRRELVETFGTWLAREGDGVQRARGGTDNQVRGHPGFAQRPQHADLRRGQAATALEDERDTSGTETTGDVGESHQITSVNITG